MTDAIHANNISLVQKYIDNGFDLNKEYSDDSYMFDVGYESPLLKACSINNFNMIYFLVEHGADVNFTSHRGVTPLIALCGYEYWRGKLKGAPKENIIVPALEYLISKGALKTVDSVYKNEGLKASFYVSHDPYLVNLLNPLQTKIDNH
jgi:ankyrin repeat protein